MKITAAERGKLVFMKYISGTYNMRNWLHEHFKT
jgi:hypothetical protein